MSLGDFIVAIDQADTKQVQLLLSQVGDLDDQRALVSSLVDDYGVSVISLAAESGNTDILSLLVEASYPMNINRPDLEGNRTALHFACLSPENSPCVKLLIEKGAKLLCRDCLGCTPLHYCCKHGCKSSLVYILDALSEPQEAQQIVDSVGWSPLHYAASNKRMDCISVLLERGSLISLRDKNGRTALQLAQEREYQEVCSLLNQKT